MAVSILCRSLPSITTAWGHVCMCSTSRVRSSKSLPPGGAGGAGAPCRTRRLDQAAHVIFTVAGATFAAGGANACNMYYDRDIDGRAPPSSPTWSPPSSSTASGSPTASTTSSATGCRQSIVATVDAERSWVDHVNESAERTLYGRSRHTWFWGANTPGKPRVFLPYIGGVAVYGEKLM